MIEFIDYEKRLSDWERLNEIIQKNGKNIFSRVANNIE